MNTNYERALAAVLVHEGGYVNHPRDPGGATNRGVTQKVYDAWRQSRGIARRSVWGIGSNEVDAIYRELYWDRVRGDDLPAGIDYAVFDYAINSGVSRAVTYLQRALGVAADGAIGPVTLRAATTAPDRAALIERMLNARLSFLMQLKHWRDFGRGWRRRVEGVRVLAKAMAAGR